MSDRHRLPGSSGEKRLQQRLGTVERATGFYENAMRSRLNADMRTFLAARETYFVGCATADGPPRVRVRTGREIPTIVDDGRIAWQEHPDSPLAERAREADHGTVTTVDWEETTVGLHVNGALAVRSGSAGPVWCELEIDEAYIHCAKHLPQLRRVDPDATPDDAGPPTGVTHGTPPWLPDFLQDRIFFMLGTADVDGETDISPRFGPRGFVHRTPNGVTYPEFRGNGVHASLGNMMETGRACLTFVEWWQSGRIVHLEGEVALNDAPPDGVTERFESDRTKLWVTLSPTRTVVADLPEPRYAIEEFAPHWGTDDAELKKAGFFTE